MNEKKFSWLPAQNIFIWKHQFDCARWKNVWRNFKTICAIRDKFVIIQKKNSRLLNILQKRFWIRFNKKPESSENKLRKTGQFWPRFLIIWRKVSGTVFSALGKRQILNMRAFEVKTTEQEKKTFDIVKRFFSLKIIKKSQKPFKVLSQKHFSIKTFYQKLQKASKKLAKNPLKVFIVILLYKICLEIDFKYH